MQSRARVETILPGRLAQAQRCMEAPELYTWSGTWPQPVPQGASSKLSSLGQTLILDMIFIFILSLHLPLLSSNSPAAQNSLCQVKAQAEYLGVL